MKAEKIDVINKSVKCKGRGSLLRECRLVLSVTVSVVREETVSQNWSVGHPP